MNPIPIETRARHRALGYWFLGVSLTVGCAAMRGSPWRGGAQLHTLMEGLAFLLALMVGAMALVRFYAKKDNTFLFIGTGFLGTALLDGYHAVVTSAFFAPYLPSDLGALIPWSWVASRLFLSALMCLSLLAWRRERRLGAAGRIGEHTVYLITSALTLASFLFFAFVPLPRAYYPEIVFHRPEEFVPALLFLVALAGYLRKGEWRRDVFEHWLVLSLIVGFLSQVLFMSFSDTLFDLMFDAAHLLKKVSYVCVLTGLLFSMYAIFRQVEEREENSRETSKVLSATIENFPGGISVFDADLKLIAYNRTFVDVLDFPQGLINNGSRYEDIIRFNAERGEYGEGCLAQQIQARVDLARKFEPHFFERTRPDGTIIEVRGVPMPGGGFLTTYANITERKRSEQAVKWSEQKLRAIFESVADGVITTGETGIVQSFNQSAEKLFGYGASDVIGQNISMLMPEAFARNHDSHMARYERTKGRSIIGQKRELLGLRKDGTSFPMDLTIAPAVISDQRMITGVIRDITETKRQEESLRIKTAKLALIQSVSSNANEVNDTEEFIQNCIDSICKFFKWPVGHVWKIEKRREYVAHPMKIWHLADPARFEAFRRESEEINFELGAGLPGRVLASGKAEWIGDVIQDSNFPRSAVAAEVGIKVGFAFPVKVRNECIMVLEFFSCKAESPDSELLAVIDNISQQISRRMEREQTDRSLRIAKEAAEHAEMQALSAAAEAAEASMAKSEFLANMSHELRTPLNAMLGFSELIEHEVLGPLGHEQYAEYIGIIASSGRHLLTVINDILDYSKIEAGKLELDPQPFELSEVTDSAVELLASSAHEKAIELACFIEPEVPMNLVGDASRLRQIIFNLIGNAIKFTQEGGVEVEVSLKADRGEEVLLRFEISDTGIGISEVALEKLFEKFNQADTSTTRVYGGTGLGLAISKRLIELMNGKIGVDSELGQGSTFWFTVALGRQAKAGTGSLAKTMEVMRGRHVLVVDGSTISQQVCKKYLEMLGAKVMAVDDARAALSALAGAANDVPFDMAIIDHMLPGIDGVELGYRIRAEARYDDLKMVLSSSSGLVISHKNAHDLGFEAALPKPLRRKVVLDCLAFLHDRDLPLDGVEVREATLVSPGRGGLRILVAEDNTVNQLLLNTILRSAGHEVDVANNGREAVEAAEKQVFDLILMDVHMPELNGQEATRRIRQMSGPVADVPILAVTAAVFEEDREKCHQAGMNDFVSKPIDKCQLLEKIAFWTGTAILNATDSPQENGESDDPELSEDAAAALDDLLGSMEDQASKAS